MMISEEEGERVEGVGKMLNTCVNVNKGNSVPTSEFPYTYSYLLFIQFEKKISLAYQRKFWEKWGGGLIVRVKLNKGNSDVIHIL